MFSSTNENNGFSAVQTDELEMVNGGRCPVLDLLVATVVLPTAIVANTVGNSRSK